MGAVAFKDIRNSDAERKGAFMNKGERKIDFTGFILRIRLSSEIGFLRHLLNGETDNLAHLTDSFGNNSDFICKTCVLHCFFTSVKLLFFVHFMLKRAKQKARLKVNYFETSVNSYCPRYHSNCGYRKPPLFGLKQALCINAAITEDAY